FRQRDRDLQRALNRRRGQKYNSGNRPQYGEIDLDARWQVLACRRERRHARFAMASAARRNGAQARSRQAQPVLIILGRCCCWQRWCDCVHGDRSIATGGALLYVIPGGVTETTDEPECRGCGTGAWTD